MIESDSNIEPRNQIVVQSDEICTTRNLFFQDHYGTKHHMVGM